MAVLAAPTGGLLRRVALLALGFLIALLMVWAFGAALDHDDAGALGLPSSLVPVTNTVETVTAAGRAAHQARPVTQPVTQAVTAPVPPRTGDPSHRTHRRSRSTPSHRARRPKPSRQSSSPSTQAIPSPSTQAITPILEPVTQAIEPGHRSHRARSSSPVTEAVDPDPRTRSPKHRSTPILTPVTNTLDPILTPVIDGTSPAAPVSPRSGWTIDADASQPPQPPSPPRSSPSPARRSRSSSPVA